MGKEEILDTYLNALQGKRANKAKPSWGEIVTKILVQWVFIPALLWGYWNWFGAGAVNEALPGLHAGPIDLWAALGMLLVTNVVLTHGANTREESK